MAKKRASLGKGLDALLGENSQIGLDGEVESPEPSTDIDRLKDIEISHISPSSDQPRKSFDDESLDQLAHSIRQQGVLQPIIVRTLSEGNYQLVAGERRWRAAQKAGLETIPAIINEVDESKYHVVALLENIQRQDLNPVEVSEAISRLNKEHELTHKDIAEALAISRPAVSNLLRLAELSPSIKNMLIDGSLDMGHARAILSVEEKDQLSLACYTAEQKLSVRKTEALAKVWPVTKTVKEESQQERDIQAFADRCSEALLLKVDIQHKLNGSGKITINYQSLDQLHHLTGKLVPELQKDEDLGDAT